MADDFDQFDEYELLGVAPGVTPAALKRAYHTQIGRYHPDRHGTADADVQGYAARRTIRINAAYKVLRTDPDAVRLRRAVDAPIVAATAAQTTATSPSSYNDQQAGLYDQSLAAADLGDYPRAIELMQQLIALNPFYRDAVSRLAEFERQLRPDSPRRPLSARVWLYTGFVVIVALIAGAVWLDRAAQTTDETILTASSVPVETAAATTAPVTATNGQSDAFPTPEQLVGSSTVTAEVSLGPPVPSDDTLAESGTLLLADTFATADWPTTRGNGWQYGPIDGSFVITATSEAGPIFSYRSLSGSPDMQIGVDLAVQDGVAGLLLRYNAETRSYLAFTVDPAAAEWRLDRQTNVSSQTLLSGTYTPLERVRLVARLTDARVELRIDGRRVALLRVDEPLPTNRYGVIAAAHSGGNVSASFSQLVLRAGE